MASQTYVDQDPEEQPLGELFSELTTNLQLLMRKEVELAKVEATEQAKRAGKAGAMFGATAALGFVGLLLLCFAAAWGLAAVLPNGLAFLIVAIVVLAVAGLCAVQGKKNVAAIRPPKQTVDTLKQDVQVAQTSLKRGMQSDTTPGKGR
jgi:uncharacterized membrane protein YqjE